MLYIYIWYPPKDLPNSMLLETLLATFAPIVHEADLWRENLPCIIRIILESLLIQGICPESSRNHFSIIFDSGICPESSESFGIIFDSGPARIIRIILESFLIRAGIQDPRSKIAQESLPGILDLGSWIRARIKNDSKMIWASTGSKISWEDLPGILDLGSWIRARIKNDSKMIRASTGSKISWEDLSGILDLGSWIQARIKNDCKMIRMIWAWPESRMIPK